MGTAGMGIVDAHVHLYPAEASADPVGWAVKMDEPLWAALVTPHPERRVRQGWADCDRLLRDMDAAGIERSILLGWYWERHETCVWHNRYYADCVRAHPDRLWAFATVQAQAGRQALDEMTRARDDGLIGLGELCPWSTGTSPLDPSWLDVFSRAVEMGWPVNLHATDPASRPFAGRVETPLESIIALARRLPELRLILAHWGGGLVFHELNTHARQTLRNVVYDTSATPLLYDAQVYDTAVRVAGEGRVLFGSDYPLMVFPKDQQEPDLARPLAHVSAAGLSESALARVLGANARSLLAR